jgi:hypothetical protein
MNEFLGRGMRSFFLTRTGFWTGVWKSQSKGSANGGGVELEDVASDGGGVG